MTPHEQLAKGFEALGAGDYVLAAIAARAVLRAQPDDPGAQTLLGRLALAACRPDVALEIFEALVSPSAPPATLLDLARADLDLRREDDALEAAQAAAAMAPQWPDAWSMVSEVAIALDLLDVADEALARVLVLKPGDTGALHLRARIGRASEQEVADMERALATGKLSYRDAANLHYGLSYVYKRSGDSSRFISHVLAANAAQRSGFKGPMPNLRASFERQTGAFSREAFARAATAPPAALAPIFIIGMPRSGTTLVEQIIGGAPGVAGAGEQKFFRDVLPAEMEAMTGAQFPEGFDRLSADQLSQLAYPLLRLLGAIGNSAPFVTDKTLDNFQRIGLLLHMFPDCKVVCLRRDPMDTCFSILQQQFNDRIVQTFDLELMGEACRRFSDFMGHWANLFEGRFLEVQYETLVASPEVQARRLIEFCGLEWNASHLDFHTRAGAVRTFSDQQVRQPISTASIGGWRQFADELAPLRRALEANGVAYAP